MLKEKHSIYLDEQSERLLLALYIEQLKSDKRASRSGIIRDAIYLLHASKTQQQSPEL